MHRRLHTLSGVSLRFDLQAHSIHSDGSLPAAEVVERAAGAGVELLALTDHDTVGGVSEALAAGERLDVRVIPATEISAIDDGAAREVHILAYAIDHLQPQLSECLAEFLADRERRTMRMAGALRELGWQLDEHELHARQAAGQPIGRPHLAAAVLRCPANARRLRAESIDDVGSLIGAYLTEGRPAFRLRETPTVSAERCAWPAPCATLAGSWTSVSCAPARLPASRSAGPTSPPRSCAVPAMRAGCARRASTTRAR